MGVTGGHGPDHLMRIIIMCLKTHEIVQSVNVDCAMTAALRGPCMATLLGSQAC